MRIRTLAAAAVATLFVSCVTRVAREQPAVAPGPPVSVAQRLTPRPHALGMCVVALVEPPPCASTH